MSTLITTGLKVILQVLAGVGVGELLDKFVKPKVPEYYVEPVGFSWRPLKLAWTILAFVIAFFALRFVGRKLGIKILK